MTQTTQQEKPVGSSQSSANNLLENGQDNRRRLSEDQNESSQSESRQESYFEEECESAWYVIEAVIEDVRDILRKHGHHVAESCLWSAYNAYSSFSQFAMEDLREGRIGENDREKIHLDGIRGSRLEEMQKEADDEVIMLRFLLDGMNSEGPYREEKRSKAIEYICDRLGRAARGLVYHTSSENRNEAESSAS